MKKFFFGILIVMLCSSYSFARKGGSKGYATTGVVELSGSAGFSGSRIFAGDSNNDDFSRINFYLKPSVDYFIIHGFHIGLAPDFEVLSSIYDDGSINQISIGPVLSPGYCFKLTDMLFLDVSPAFGFHYLTYTDSGDRSASYYDDDKYITFQVDVKLKIAVGHALVNVGLYERFSYHTWDDPDGYDSLSTGLSVGFSVYF
ncbi:MAG TPA: hypothetical protein PK926_08680 [Spirochaetota bacterium]|nr:hypothetical protein [Spirochaetota bacterium]HPI90096.1 hypothetical protein [Spirochaetota bacterium]HPR49536.1 hypothetical protein [Spirochaetota bacterium]